MIKYFYPILILTLYMSCNNYSQDLITFKLENSLIEKVSYQLSPDSLYSIFIQLNDFGTESLKNITNRNIGWRLKVIKNKTVIVEAVIRGEIPSGMISIDNIRESKTVLDYLKVLLEN